MDSEDEMDMVAFASYMTMSAAYLALKINAEEKNKKRRRIWMASNRDRERFGSSSNADLFYDLTKEPSGKTDNFCKMSATDFEWLLSKVAPQIAKSDTNFRKCIPAKDRLALTLRLLASGDSYRTLSSLFSCSKQLLSTIVKEVCSALINILGQYIQAPTNSEQWLKIAEKWNSKFNFPHCLGAVGSRNTAFNINTSEPENTYNVITLMAVVDADYSFIFADVSSLERFDNSYDFWNTSFSRNLEHIHSMLPVDEPLPGRILPVPYLFVGNEAFPLNKYIMAPYSNINENSTSEKVFNSRLLRVNQVAENVFGIMASTFRVLRKPLLQKQEEKATNVVMSCIALHNFLVRSKTSSSRYIPPGSIDCELEGKTTSGSWRDDNIPTSFLPLQEIPMEPSLEAIKIRDEISKYFIACNTN